VDQNRQRLFPYTALTDDFYSRYGVFTVFKCARKSDCILSLKCQAFKSQFSTTLIFQLGDN